MSARALRSRQINSSAPEPRRSNRIGSKTPSEPATPPRLQGKARGRHARGLSLDSAPLTSSPQQNSRAINQPIQALATSKRLSTVQETTPVDESEADDDDDGNIEERRRIRSASILSAATGFTIDAIEAIRTDSDKLRRALPDLHNFSQINLNFANRDVSSVERLTGLKSDIARDEMQVVKNFEKTFEDFTKDCHWIFRQYVTAGLLDSEPGQSTTVESHLLDEVVCLANLAKMLLSLARWQLNDSMATNLQTLVNHFPQVFMLTQVPSDESGSAADLDERTFNVALDLRTQLAIAILRYSDTDPDMAVGDVLITGWIGAVNGPFENKLVSRVEAIRKFFNVAVESAETGQYVDIDGLQQDFPWEECVRHTFTWISRYTKELNAKIVRKGGFDEILQTLDQQIEKQDSHIADTKLGQADLTVTAAPQQVLDLDYSNRPKANKRKIMAQIRAASIGGTMPQPSSSAARQPEPSVLRSSNVISQQVTSFQPSVQDASDVDAPPTRPHRLQKRPFSLLDRQSGASKVPPIDEHGLLSQRTVVELVSEGDRESSVGFQNDTRSVERRRQPLQPSPVIRERTAPPPSVQVQKRPTRKSIREITPTRSPLQIKATPSSVKRPRLEQTNVREAVGDGDDPNDEDFEPNDEATVNQENENPVQLDVDEDAPPATAYRTVNQMAKRATQVQQSQAAEPQKRRGWTMAEEEAFIRYIREIGISWKNIKDHDMDTDRLLLHRNQVQLKDKARNMKFDFIKARVPLPRNFIKIPLSRTLWERLEAYGIRQGDELETE